jgi:hypothetical protein
MNASSILVILGLIALGIFVWRRFFTTSKSAANVGEGIWPGQKTYFADAVLAERGLLVKIGSTPLNVAIAGAADQPIGLTTDEAAAIGDPVEVELLGSAKETKLMVASAAIAAGAFIMPAANGRVQTLGSTTGTYYVVGRCLKPAAAAGDLIEVDPAPCMKIVIP